MIFKYNKNTNLTYCYKVHENNAKMHQKPFWLLPKTQQIKKHKTYEYISFIHFTANGRWFISFKLGMRGIT
jgi:hypothetical protein